MSGARKPRLLVTGLCPDRINSNTRIRQAVAQGAVESDLFDDVSEAPIEVVLSHGLIQADYVLAVGGGASDTIQFEVLQRRCKTSGSLLLFWTHEDPYEFDLNCRLHEIADFYFTNEKATLPYYDGSDVTWLPLAADRRYFRQVTAVSERSIDLFFCGYGYPLRLHILRCLSFSLSENFVLAVYGPNLKQHFPKMADDRHLSLDEMADIAGHSLLTLNIGRDLAIANARFNIVAETPGPRTFDIGLSGAPQIIFDDGVLIDQFYERKTEILTFDHPEDIAGAISRLRAEPQAMIDIATAAQNRTLACHMYKHRLGAIVDKVKRT